MVCSHELLQPSATQRKKPIDVSFISTSSMLCSQVTKTLANSSECACSIVSNIIYYHSKTFIHKQSNTAQPYPPQSSLCLYFSKNQEEYDKTLSRQFCPFLLTSPKESHSCSSTVSKMTYHLHWLKIPQLRRSHRSQHCFHPAPESCTQNQELREIEIDLKHMI